MLTLFGNKGIVEWNPVCTPGWPQTDCLQSSWLSLQECWDSKCELTSEPNEIKSNQTINLNSVWYLLKGPRIMRFFKNICSSSYSIFFILCSLMLLTHSVKVKFSVCSEKQKEYLGRGRWRDTEDSCSLLPHSLLAKSNMNISIPEWRPVHCKSVWAAKEAISHEG